MTVDGAEIEYKLLLLPSIDPASSEPADNGDNIVDEDGIENAHGSMILCRDDVIDDFHASFNISCTGEGDTPSPTIPHVAATNACPTLTSAY